MDWQTVVNITYYLYKMEFSEEHNKIYGQVILTERKQSHRKEQKAWLYSLDIWSAAPVGARRDNI